MKIKRKLWFAAALLVMPLAAFLILVIKDIIYLPGLTDLGVWQLITIILSYALAAAFLFFFLSKKILENHSSRQTPESNFEKAGQVKRNIFTPGNFSDSPGVDNLLKSGLLFEKVWKITTDGLRLTNKDGNIIAVNDAFCNIVGLSRDKLLQQPFFNIYEKELRDQLLNEYIEDFKSGNVKTGFEKEVCLWNGRRVWLDFSNSLIHISAHNTLLLSTIRDITGRKKSEASLKKYADQLRGLASHLQSVREEERTMIAREIHDELGQVLTVLKIQITLLANKLRDDQPELKEKILNAAKVIDETVESVQKISAKLRPGILDNLGLVPAIEWQAQEYQKNTGIKCECYLPKDDIILNEEKSTAVFRIFQEALTNAGRHSSADVVMISLFKNNGALTLSISDNGCGITEAQKNDPNSLGLLGMKERVLLLNGEFEIFGKENRGTTVRAIVPLEYPGESFY